MKWDNKTVLVTGGAGFIGRNICSRLLCENAKVVVADNFSYSSPSDVIDDVDLVNVDVSNSIEFSKSLSGYDFDFIFHFAAPSSVILFNHNPVNCFNNTTSGVLNVFNYAQKNNVKKVIFPSSGSVYGKSPPPQSENLLPEPVNLYAIAKLSTEYIAQYFSENVKYVGLRIFAGYGPGESHKKGYSSPVTLFLRSILANQSPIIFGNGSQSRDFVYIDDIVNAVFGAIKTSFSGGVVNIGSGSSYTFNEVVSIINDLLDKQTSPKYVKKPLSYLEKTCADTRLMKKLFSFEPLNLCDGLRKYLNSSYSF